MSEKDRVREEIVEEIVKVLMSYGMHNEFYLKGLEKIAGQILSIKGLAVIDEDAKVPQRRAYKRTVLNAYNLESEIYLQGQIDAQQDMHEANFRKVVP